MEYFGRSYKKAMFKVKMEGGWCGGGSGEVKRDFGRC